MAGDATSFHRKHPGVLVLQTSLIIAGIIVIALSLSIPDGCIFGVTAANPNGNQGVCVFHSVVSFVGLFMGVLGIFTAYLVSSARNNHHITSEHFVWGAISCFLIAGLWLLDACLVSGYFDLTCSNVPRCQDVRGWNVGGWNVTGAWCSMALWFFAFLAYVQFSRLPPNDPTAAKKLEEVTVKEDATWSVSQAEIVRGPRSETITLKCNDPNPFTIVVHGISDDGHTPICERVTIDGERIHPAQYHNVVNALRKAIVPHQEDVLAVDRALLIMQNADPILADAGLQSGPEDRFSRDENKHDRLAEERLRQELLEQKRMNQALQRALDERQLAAETGRQRAQSEQEKEASQLLQQMVELEALQQKQHADHIAALERQIAQLKRAAGAQDGGKQVWDGEDTH